jgi:hypothetical protein
MTRGEDATSELKIVDALGKELERVTQRRGVLGGLRGRVRRGGRKTFALALAGVFVAAGAAGATTGALSVGDVIPGGDPAPPPENRLSVDETVLATGAAPVAGPWRMTAYASEQSEGQPAGLPCVRLVLTNPPKGTPLAGSGFCGEVGDDFGAASLPVINSSGQAVLLIFGIAPEKAATVELAAAGGAETRTQTQDGVGDARRGDVFVLVVPPGSHQGELRWLDEKGEPGAKQLDASGFFDRLESVQRLRP